MKQTLKTLYDIDASALIQYTDKVYKVEDSSKNEYCLKYTTCNCKKEIVEKIKALNMQNSFVMPLSTCIRSFNANKDNKTFLVSKWIDDDNVSSKDLKIKYYLKQIAKLHNQSLYSVNVSFSYFNEVCMSIEEKIEECYQKYENIVYDIERKEYKSPFEWYFISFYYQIIKSLDESRANLDKLKNLTRDKSTLNMAITHQNFSYDHVFILNDKIIGNDKMALNTPLFDLISLFNNVEFGTIDLSKMLNEYFSIIKYDDYEIKWLLALLFIPSSITITDNEFNNINQLMQILFKIKSVFELSDSLNSEKK